jgi:hypothetical protein
MELHPLGFSQGRKENREITIMLYRFVTWRQKDAGDFDDYRNVRPSVETPEEARAQMNEWVGDHSPHNAVTRKGDDHAVLVNEKHVWHAEVQAYEPQPGARFIIFDSDESGTKEKAENEISRLQELGWAVAQMTSAPFQHFLRTTVLMTKV